MSSKRALRRKACDGKVRHEDKQSAVIAARATRKPGEMLSVYRCIYCRKYHVGHPPAFVRRAMMERGRI